MEGAEEIDGVGDRGDPRALVGDVQVDVASVAPPIVDLCPVFLPWSVRMSATTTFAPSWAKRTACAAPCPLAAPVIRATWLRSLMFQRGIPAGPTLTPAQTTAQARAVAGFRPRWR